jgi:hypothetical protein
LWFYNKVSLIAVMLIITHPPCFHLSGLTLLGLRRSDLFSPRIDTPIYSLNKINWFALRKYLEPISSIH